MEDINIVIQPTPNPNALKFILPKKVIESGKASYKSAVETSQNPLAGALFTIRGVDQVHFFENVITISKFGYEDWDAIEPSVIDCIKERLHDHNPDFVGPDPEAERRKSLPEDLLKIEEILDKTVRPGLQGDGGDLRAVSYDDNILLIRYEGACGTCPSSTTGTLMAIKSILQDQFNPEIEVYIDPSSASMQY